MHIITIMIILGIETSCDETSLCLLEKKEVIDNGKKTIKYRILAHSIHSQIELHKEYGGVYPALAKREHIKNLPIMFENIMLETKIKHSDINLIAVTEGPGLEPALWTGIVFAKELSIKHNIPIIPINHMEGHIVSTMLKNTEASEQYLELNNIDFPALGLLISGGHTELIDINNIGEYTILGQTRDDAIGEAFDKVARMLSLPYPGGPEISKMAQYARKNNIKNNITLPRPMINSKDLDFSFAGLKTSVLYLLKEKVTITDEEKYDLAREFENTVTEVIISKTKKALDQKSYGSIIVGGGVIANSFIRKEFNKLSKEYGIPLLIPLPGVTGDNALMIALAGAFKYKGNENYIDTIKAKGNLKLGK